MNSWSTLDIEPRKVATWRFCAYLDNPDNAAERTLCKENSDEAKKLFARLGEFYLEETKPVDAPPEIMPIPMKTKFLVYDDDPKELRDGLVTIVLPNQGQLGDEELFQPMEWYRCTYPPYDPLRVAMVPEEDTGR